METRTEHQPLTAQEQTILDLEAHFWQSHTPKSAQINALGLSATRYYQLLGRLIDTPAAYLHNPMLVKRLLRIREHKRSFATKTVTPVYNWIALSLCSSQ
ncbi:MAG: DUF3263 domain-containing protein [Propionibacteriaceae bacterium]|jgi:hypothetical protein|nr:DUF3263 domain-containing protein [Propionibacteriaceae bacterium]